MGVDLFILLNWLSKQPSFQLQQGYHLIPAYLSNKEYIYGICKPSGWGLALNFPSVGAVAGLGGEGKRKEHEMNGEGCERREEARKRVLGDVRNWWRNCSEEN